MKFKFLWKDKNMDKKEIKNIPRRLRRKYRSFGANGEIIYSDVPKEDNVDTKKRNTPQYKNINIPDEQNQDKSLLSLTEIEGIEEPEEKQEIDTRKNVMISRTLERLSQIIKPSIDEIADMIYIQLKENKFPLEEKAVKQIIEKSKQYIPTIQKADESGYFDIKKQDTKEQLELLVTDVYDQIHKQDIKEKEKQKEKKEEQKQNEEKKQKEQKEQKTKDKDTKQTKEKETKEKPKQDKQEKSINELLGNDEDNDTFSEEDNDLGLKF